MVFLILLFSTFIVSKFMTKKEKIILVERNLPFNKQNLVGAKMTVLDEENLIVY